MDFIMLLTGLNIDIAATISIIIIAIAIISSTSVKAFFFSNLANFISPPVISGYKRRDLSNP